MGGEIPLMDGAEIVKESLFNGSGSFELEVDVSPEEVARFYNQAMEEKGWPSGMVMSVGNQSVLMLNRQGDQFVLKAESENGRTRVIITLIRKAQAQEAAVQRDVIPPSQGQGEEFGKKDPGSLPEDPSPDPEDSSSSSSSDDQSTEPDHTADEIPEILPVSLHVTVRWDVVEREDSEGYTRYKGFVTYQFNGVMKLYAAGSPTIQKANRVLMPVLTYKPEVMTLTYTYNEKMESFYPKPKDHCQDPLTYEYQGGGVSQIDDDNAAGLKIIRFGSTAEPYLKNLSADKQQFLADMQLSTATPDYYEFYVGGPGQKKTIPGRKRVGSKDCLYQSSEINLPGLGGGVQMKIPESGAMQGTRTWSADDKGKCPPTLSITVSDITPLLEMPSLRPPEGGKKNVTYTVSWMVGETAESPITATADEDKEKNCEELQKRIDFIKIVRKTYADQSLRDSIKEAGGTHKDYQKAVEKRVMKETHSGNGAPGKANILMETVPFYDSPECTNIVKIEIRGIVEGTTKTLILYDAEGNQVDDTEDFWKLQQDWEEFYGEEAGQCLFKAAVRHEECHVKQFVKQGKIKSIDDRAERELEAFRIEQKNLEKDFTDMDC
jgi:hypothetical protein